MPRKLVNVSEISSILSVKPSTVYQWVHEGRIPHFKIGKLVRFDPAEIDRWVGKQKARTLASVDLP